MMDAHLIAYFRHLLHYDPATGALTWRADGRRRVAGHRAGHHNTALGYRTVFIGNDDRYEHRIAWAIHYGELPYHRLDHRNLDRSDNRIQNLREASHRQNMANTGLRSNNRSGFKGVHRRADTGRYSATIKDRGCAICIGSFDSAEDAAQAYNTAAVAIHGEFAWLNQTGEKK